MQASVRDAGEARLEPFAQPAQPLDAPVKFLGRERRASAEADQGRDVLGAGPPPTLLAAAEDERLEGGALPDPERGRAHRSVELVRRDHEVVRPQGPGIDGELARRLHRVAQERHAPGPARRRRLGHRLHRTQFVVRKHQTRQPRARAQRRRHRARLDHAVSARAEPGHVHTEALEPVRGGLNRRMLEFRDHQVTTAAATGAGEG